MTTPFFAILDSIDLALTRSVDDLEFDTDIQPLLVEPAARKYFFEKVSDPEWLPFLAHAGVFDVPPHVEDGSANEIQRWYSSEMLARMASEAPQAVAEVLEDIPDTDNPHVHADIVRALEHLPVHVARFYVPRIRDWLNSDYRSPESQIVAKLASNLLRAGHESDALTLFGSMLTFSTPEDVGGGIELQSKLNPWHFEEIVRTTLLPLVADHPIVVDFLTNLLHEAVLLSARSNARPNDFSYIWLPYVGSSSDHLQGIRSVLATAVVKAAKTSIKSSRSDAGSVVSALDCRGWDVFRRISLHLLVGSELVDEVIERLCSPDYFDSIALRREYIELLEDSFDTLPASAKTSVLKLIDKGPEPTRTYRRAVAIQEGDQSLSEIQQELADEWRRDWLSVIAGSLPVRQTKDLERLSARYGAPRDISRPYDTSGVWVGPTSPVPDEELAEMDIDSLVAFLATWENQPGFGKPSREGLARSLKNLVTADAQRFSSYAPAFARLRPEYLYWYLMGLRDAIPDSGSDLSSAPGTAFDWPAVLTLCEILAESQLDEGEAQDKRSGARGAVASLLASALDRNAVPMELGSQILKVASRLTDDPDPSPETEQDWEDPHRPYQTAINSVRSRALEVVIKYALWLHRNQKPVESNWKSLDPEVEPILETHLDVRHEKSLAVRSVYGRWYPWLLLLDKPWAAENVRKIFPADPEDKAYWRAAFETYLMFCPAYDAVLPVLEEEYSRAIDELCDRTTDEAQRGPDNVVNHLASHLMTFYLRGLLKLPGVVTAFFTQSSPSARGEAIEFVGRSLHNSEKLPRQIAMRSLKLWEWRLKSLGSLAETERKEELGAFAWWFTSRQLNGERSLIYMLETLKLGAGLDFQARAILETLAELCEVAPSIVAEIVATMTDQLAHSPSASIWSEHMHAVLEKLLGTDETRRAAEEVLDNLGRAGLLQFRDLAQGV